MSVAAPGGVVPSSSHLLHFTAKKSHRQRRSEGIFRVSAYQKSANSRSSGSAVWTSVFLQMFNRLGPCDGRLVHLVPEIIPKTHKAVSAFWTVHQPGFVEIKGVSGRNRCHAGLAQKVLVEFFLSQLCLVDDFRFRVTIGAQRREPVKRVNN